jgi:transketolase
MEGMSNEACSLAGHWGLGKLIALYDDNSISIDGKTDITHTEDVCKRYEALGWHVQRVEEGNLDLDALRKAIKAAQEETDRPSLINVTTVIGYGSPNMAGTAGVHGSAIGIEEAQLAREKIGWKHGPFEVPEDVYKEMRDKRVEAGRIMEEKWNAAMEEYRQKYPEEAGEIDMLRDGRLPEGWERCLPEFKPGDGDATRKHSHKVQ